MQNTRLLNQMQLLVTNTLVVAALLFIRNSCMADVVLYTLPGTDLTVALEGKSKRAPGGFIKLKLDAGSLVLNTSNCEVIDLPTKWERLTKAMRKAKAEANVDAYLDAARLALRSGRIKQVYSCLSEAYKIAPDNAVIQRCVQANKMIKSAVPTSPEDDEARFREIIDRTDMNILCSKHYILMHDIPKRRSPKHETRAVKRLKLLETVYASFFLKFALEGYPLEPPKERMMVMLFGDEEDYLHYVTLLDPSLKNASGFWAPGNNVAVFFDQSTTESLSKFRAISKGLMKKKTEIRRLGNRSLSREFAQLANTVEVLSGIAENEADVEVVTHEATHQLAGNSGLLPRDMIFLRWAHEGLAAYFETPSGEGWGGIGAVNSSRLKWYRLLANVDREHSNVEFIVSDKIFDYAATNTAEVAAYGQAWGLTHFLMEERFDAYMEFFALVRDIDPELTIPQKQNEVKACFTRTVGSPAEIEDEWRTYMRRLKTDIDRAMSKR